MIPGGRAMFGPLGFPELVFILVLALLIFGPKRLPEVGKTIGKGVAQFRRATTDLKRTIESEIALADEPASTQKTEGRAPRSAPRPVAEAIPTRPAALPAPAPPPAPTDPPEPTDAANPAGSGPA
jgi:TatA/E family protein of Tat protein translocase